MSSLVLLDFLVTDVGENTDQRECALLKQLRNAPDLLERVVSSTASDFRLQQELREEYSPETVRAALTLIDNRRRAVSKFRRADQMWFDPVGLEQATSESVARYKAQRFSGSVSDWCCGIGMDSIGLALQGCDVQSVDWREANCLRTQWNADAFGIGDRIATLAKDVRSVDRSTEFVHIDPDRRSKSGQRLMRVEDCEPDLEFLLQMMPSFSGGAIKLSPASNFGGKFIEGPIEIELISLNGECKEATVWFGDLAGEDSFRATCIREPHSPHVSSDLDSRDKPQFSVTSIAADPLSAWTQVNPIGEFVYDPDPAIVRAGLVDVLAEQLGMWRLDDAEEYLTSDQLVQSPFVQAFRVVRNLPNNDKEIRRAFRAGDYGQVEIKCRHIPIKAELVRKKLPLEGNHPIALIYTRQAGKARAVICDRLQ